MALPKIKPEIPNLPPEVLARYREFVIGLIEKAGFRATKRTTGKLIIIGGFAHFVLEGTLYRAWVSQKYVRIFEKGPVKNLDRWFAITDARPMDALLKEIIPVETS